MQLFRIPKVQLALALFLITLTTLIQFPLFFVAKIFVFSVLFTVGTELLFLYLRKHMVFVPYAAIVTGLILALTIDPRLPWYGILLISVIATGAKHFIRFSDRHVFNPAAIGLVAGSMLLQSTVSWWGVSFQIFTQTPVHTISFLILLLPFLVSGMRMRRFGSIGAFLFTYSVLLYLLNNGSPYRIITDPTVLFFAIVMLPEPMTSPVVLQRQIFYGGFIAIAAVMFSYLPFSRSLFAAHVIPDGLLPFLLIGNLLFFKLR